MYWKTATTPLLGRVSSVISAGGTDVLADGVGSRSRLHGALQQERARVHKRGHTGVICGKDRSPV